MAKGGERHPKADPHMEHWSTSGPIDPPVLLLELGDESAGIRFSAYDLTDTMSSVRLPSGMPHVSRTRFLLTRLEAWSSTGAWTVSNLLVMLDELDVLSDNLECWTAGYSDVPGLCLPPIADPEFHLELLELSEGEGALFSLEFGWWQPDLKEHYQTTGEPTRFEFRASLRQMSDGTQSCRAAIAKIDAIPVEPRT